MEKITHLEVWLSTFITQMNWGKSSMSRFVERNLNKISLVFIISVFLLPNISLASNDLWYGSLKSIDGSQANIEYRGLEKKYNFSCNIDTASCVSVSVFPPKSIITQNTEKKVLVKFPANSVRNNISSTGRYGFYLTVSDKKKSRVVSLVDGLKNKKYTVSEYFNFWDLLEEQIHLSRFAPDDSSMAYVSDRSGFMSLYVVSLSNLSSKKLGLGRVTSGVSVGDFIYADANTILYVANNKVDPYNWILFSYNLNTKKKKILAEHLTYDSVLHQVGKQIVFTRLSDRGTEPVILTDYNGGEIKNFNLPISAPSFMDSIKYSYQKIAGTNTVLMKSINNSTIVHPLIVWLHGGPYRQTSFNRHTYISYGVYDWILEEAVSKGAYVLKVDYPGSYGAGRALTESIKSGVGLVDVKSVMNVVNAFTKNNKVDGVYVVGNSYGGYLALKSVSSYPNKITNALSINGVTDWKALLNIYQNSIFNTFFGGLPSSKNKKLFTQASIIDNLSKLKNPVYVIQGESDTTIPKSQAILLKNKLDDADKISNLTLIPGENHVFSKDSSINTICKALFEMTKLDATNSCNLSN
ncbi:MAG: alpha/beta fold hydrolase [bacterium]